LGAPAWLRESWDRLVASDPGLSRLRMAVGGAGSLATALGLELAAATLLGLQGMQVVLFLLMGGIVALLGSMPLSGVGPGTWVKVRTAVFFPVAFGVGITVGVLADGRTDLVLSLFVAMTFLAVVVRRFGIPFFFYGFMSWIGYLFASLLGATFAILPMLLLALSIGAGWVLLLSLTVLRTSPQRTLSRTLHAFHARVRTVAAVCADLANIDAGDRRDFGRWRARLHRHQRRLVEAALMIEASSGQRQALPDAGSGRRLRNYALDAQLAIDALAGSIETIAISTPGRAGQAAQVANLVARRNLAGAAHAAERFQQSLQQTGRGPGEDWWPAYRLTEAVSEFAALAAQVHDFSPAGLSRTDQPASGDEEADEFRPAVELMMGNLPNSGALARDITGRGPQWLLGRLSMTTRQAIQVAVAAGAAIVAGHALSGHRYYWALIAVFVTFTGAATRAESVRKAVYRMVGTLTGLVIAMLLAHVTAGHTLPMMIVIVASFFCGFYLIRVSYAFMIFFITIMVAQLYNVLGEYSNELLVLRLEETAIGAGIGIAVALIFLPLSTRDTVRAARNNLFTTLAQALHQIAHQLDQPADSGEPVNVPAHRPASSATMPAAGDGHASACTQSDEHAGEEPVRPGLEELARQLDDNTRQLALVATPFSRPAMWGNNGRHLRYRLTRFAAIAANIRAIAVTLRRATPIRQPALADRCRMLADAAANLTTHDRRAENTAGEITPEVIRYRLSPGIPDSKPPPHYAITRSLTQIDDLLAEISPPAAAAAESTGAQPADTHSAKP
jgi:hypothetical protein